MKSNGNLTLGAKVLVVMVVLIAFGVFANAQDDVYVVNILQQFGIVNLETGSFHVISTTPETQANLVWGHGGVLYSLSVSGNLVTINPKTGETKVVGATGLGFNAFGLGEVREKLYATDFSNNLYSVDATSGLATLIGATGMPPDPTIPFTINPDDGTLNLCDETLYGVNGKLYATFDSFKLDMNTLAMTPVVNAALYEIDPSTGKATVIGPTSMNLGASVQDDGRFYAFHLTPIGFNEFGPVVTSDLVRLDLRTGTIKSKIAIDPSAAAIFGAIPVRGLGDHER